jgi:hypothetical protein
LFRKRCPKVRVKWEASEAFFDLGVDEVVSPQQQKQQHLAAAAGEHRRRRYRTPSPKLLRQRREAANARERRRMDLLNDWFETVRSIRF